MCATDELEGNDFDPHQMEARKLPHAEACAEVARLRQERVTLQAQLQQRGIERTAALSREKEANKNWSTSARKLHVLSQAVDTFLKRRDDPLAWTALRDQHKKVK